jgi:hypothetical protein
MSQPRAYKNRAGARTKRKEASLIDVEAVEAEVGPVETPMRLTGLAGSTTTEEVGE